MARFEQLYGNNNGCLLPCWWGIMPGVTSWGETLHFLNQFSGFSRIEADYQYSLTDNPKNFTHYIWRFPSPYPQAFVTRVDFEVQNGIVVAISLWDDIGGHMFHLDKLYSDYGRPDRIFIVPEKCTQGLNFCQASISFIYDNQRFLFENQVYGAINDKTVSLCVFESNYGHISTWSSGVDIDLNFRVGDEAQFVPFEQASQVTIEEFFEQYHSSVKLETCFDVSIDLWK
jgi:hypothetical protein